MAKSVKVSTRASLVLNGFSNSSRSEPIVGAMNEPGFRLGVTYGETDLPVTPVFMNAVELSAQYAEMDYMGRTRRRHGVVLPNFPQVEIAVIPAVSATTIEVRMVIWAIYGATIDMVYRKSFKECEISIIWNDETVGYLYFTEPAEDVPHDSDLGSIGLANAMASLANLSATAPNITTTGTFDWKPLFKPDAKNLQPRDVFILTLGAIKTIAVYRSSDKVEGAFHVGSEIVDANMQVYLWHRRTPRTNPPFLLYTHVLEAVRQIPGWMLGQSRFAEFHCAIKVNSRAVGLIVMDKGPYILSSAAAESNLTSF